MDDLARLSGQVSDEELPGRGVSAGVLLETSGPRGGFVSVESDDGQYRASIPLERGVGIPIHPGLLRSLEVVLEMPEGLLSPAAGFGAPDPETPRMTIRQSLDSLAESGDEPAEHPLDLEADPPAGAPPQVGSHGSPELRGEAQAAIAAACANHHQGFELRLSTWLR